MLKAQVTDMTNADFTILLPEILLAIYAMGALMFGVYTGKDKTAPLTPI